MPGDIRKCKRLNLNWKLEIQPFFYGEFGCRFSCVWFAFQIRFQPDGFGQLPTSSLIRTVCLLLVDSI